MSRALIAFLLSAAALPAVAQVDGSTPPADQSEAWIEAEANRPNVKTAPSFVDGPHAELPESEKAQGHHGAVVIQGIIAADGRMKEARVRLSSRAPAVDDIALAAAKASIFVPAKDADGAPLPIVISMPFDLVAYKAYEGMGLLQYKCGQFVRDMDWWKAAHPERSFGDHELYQMESGFEMLSLIRRAKGNQDVLKQSIDGFATRWVEAIEYCRRKPNILQRDAIYR